MAKVYDALKQVEAERTRQLRTAEASKVVSRPEATFWKRFSGRLSRNGELGDDGEPERVAHERLETIIGRLDAFENLASKKIPELERNLLQLLQDRIDVVEREVAASVSALGNQMRSEAAVLNRRISWLLGAVVVLLVAVLLRG